MKKTSKPIVFFGTEDFSLGALKSLVEAGFNIAAIVTKPDSPRGRGHKLTPPLVKTYALEHNIAVWQPTKLHDITDNIKKLTDPAGVLVSYGKIIPQSIIDLFSPGIINVHPSLLPLYRGPSPIEAAILNGDHKTGVSIMQLSAAMDAGPIYHQELFELRGNETGPALLDELGAIGIKNLIDLLPAILDDNLTSQPQDSTAATYCKLINKADSIVDWHKPAVQLEREIRAYLGWPGSRATLGETDVIITSATVLPQHTAAPGTITVDEQRLIVATSNGSLSPLTLKPFGKKEMPIRAFLAGYGSRLR